MSRVMVGKSSRVWLILLSVGIVQFICYKASTPLRHSAALLLNGSGVGIGMKEEVESGSLINYYLFYDLVSIQYKPIVFMLMLIWLSFLFLFVGITAADFFCPNLNTIASRLGLSESVAGVTFLAWSNGSPDVFSTFSALRAHAGSLAIGELLGAASFITMLVAGTMCLIKPFRVSPHTFLRDVGFFTIAVSFTLRILWDNHIHLWEAASMVALYIIYVIFVALGSWWNSRKERKRELLRQARSEYAQDIAQYQDQVGDSPTSQRKSRASSGATTPTTFPFPSSPYLGTNHPHQHEPLDEDTLYNLSERGTPITLTRRRSGSTSTATSPLARRPKSKSTVRPSLLGAIEFRDVVNSLRADSSARTLAVFSGLGEDRHTHAALVGTEYVGGRNSSLSHKRSSSHTGAISSRSTPIASPSIPNGVGVFGGTEGRRLPTKSLQELGAGSRRATWGAVGGPWEEEESEEGREAPLIDLSQGVENPWSSTREALFIQIPSQRLSRQSSQTSLTEPTTLRRVPSILLTNEIGDEETVLVAPSIPGPAIYSIRHKRSWLIFRAVFFSLFPSLQEFKQKSWVGKFSGIFCVPAILVLHLTLPVVDSEQDDCDSIEEKEWHTEEVNYRDFETPPLEWNGEAQTALEIERRSAKATRNLISTEFHSHVLPQPEMIPIWDSPALDLREVDEGLRRGRDGEEEEERLVKPGLESPTNSLVDEVVIEVEVVTRWLTAVQCLLAPIFCTTALFIGPDFEISYLIGALGVGIISSTLAFYNFKNSHHPGRIILCFVGFFVAMVWILMIVNEVVGVLQAIGKIFGLSNAILGLTIFAMGNSLGDLVANATVARMGFPSMAIAACFGGPMLNLLLGIGLSGCYIIYQNGGEPYQVEMGKTLIVSGVSLLIVLVATLILVPLNGYWMNRRLGAGLIGAYVVVLATNVLVEIFWS